MLRDPATSLLDARHKALFQFIDTVNSRAHAIGRDDLASLTAIGWTDEELYFAITVCALFNFYNRWVDASGVHALSDDMHRQGAKRSATAGYVRK